jgi:hypothetical protein
MKNRGEELALDQPLKAPLGWWRKKRKRSRAKGKISLETMMDKYGLKKDVMPDMEATIQLGTNKPRFPPFNMSF